MNPLWIVTLVYVVFLLVYEAYTVITGRPTITEQVRAIGRAYPPAIMLVSLGVGLLLAHFFWNI